MPNIKHDIRLLALAIIADTIAVVALILTLRGHA